ncbi:hypothetical protein [Tenggerimyces flavus]|uniref:Uncharacterized protein n=1 Tax=Tenggerimyces flavus TaxID=1708749 RepID=A0ABV7YAW8_9ACTN|nr:hypothetical protein [Tenggerimyces flavus]MBM7788898.1 hypothetical protein [Tenggerimyces flavus]
METRLAPGAVVFDGEHACIGVVEDRPHPQHWWWVMEPLNGEVLVNEAYLSEYPAPSTPQRMSP